MSTNARPSVGRFLAQVLAEVSSDYRPSVGRDVGLLCWWSMSVEYVSGVCWSSMSVDMSADTRPTLSAEISADSWPIFRPRLDRHLGRLWGKISTLGRVSAEMSVEYVGRGVDQV